MKNLSDSLVIWVMLLIIAILGPAIIPIYQTLIQM